MEIRYKKDFYPHFIDRLLPRSVRPGFAAAMTDWHLHRIDRATAPAITKLIQNTPPVPSWVELETVTGCNNTCGFCPVNRDNDPRPKITMSDELFKKIIGQFATVGYSGSIALFSNNEPLLDSKIIERVAYAKAKLPNAFHYLYTNGKLLTDERFINLMSHLDLLIIDCYSKKMRLNADENPRIKALWDKYCNAYYDNVIISMRRIDEVFGTRGGAAPNRKVGKPYVSACILPFQQMYICPDGKVRLCCQDAVWKHPELGDFNKESLNDIWHGHRYERLRDHYRDGLPRSGLAVCRDCDFICEGLNKESLLGFEDEETL